jgi:RimJ/RimL family protein N-acetyltransferase
MTIKLIPFNPAHIELLSPTQADIDRYGGDINDFMDSPLLSSGICFTAVSGGRILVVGGILLVSKHTGYGWTIVGSYASGYGMEIVRTAKSQIENMMRDLRLHRLETANLVDATEHMRWCRLLGFAEEGILRQYDDKGRDYVRMAKLMPISQEVENGV